MKEVDGKPLIEILLHRLSRSRRIGEIILATPESRDNDALVAKVESLGFRVFRGSDKDVLDRFYQAARQSQPETVVRITGDCPIIDPQLVDELLELYNQHNADYVGMGDPATFPDGLGAEVFSFSSLELTQDHARRLFDREHVTPFMRTDDQFRRINHVNDVNHSNERWTIDDPEDFEVIKNIINYFSPSLDFSWRDILILKEKHPEYFSANQNIKRDEGSDLNTGQKLWKRAKRIIPGGNMLLSKRPEMFLPEIWPTYFSKAKGCTIWDLDGNEFTDMSIMGVGTNILGYGCAEVDLAVRDVVEMGKMSTLNCPEEVYLAEKLIELHPWADMARFARSGGEANAIAVRIARAAAGRDAVAVCGYHGWHDWYLAANLGSESALDGHLLPGLEPNGVPRSLRGTIFPFNYNKFDELEELVNTHPEIGVIKTEVQRNRAPENDYLKKIRELADEKKLILIFDECTSGFRETNGGLHRKFGVEPDMAMFGKALGNGYAISAVIGKRKIMEAAQGSFVSSTFWTERIGSVAGLKTLEVMQRERSWETITNMGQRIGQRWKALGDKYDLPIQINGLSALVNFSIASEDWPKYKTFISQEMLKKRFLAGNSVYVSIAHDAKVVDGYFECIEPVFAVLAECEKGRNIDQLLTGPVCHMGFKRLN